MARITLFAVASQVFAPQFVQIIQDYPLALWNAGCAAVYRQPEAKCRYSLGRRTFFGHKKRVTEHPGPAYAYCIRRHPPASNPLSLDAPRPNNRIPPTAKCAPSF